MISGNDKLKQCPNCGTWFSAADIMYSGRIEPIGMQVEDPENPEACFFYFNDLAAYCQTTFVVPATAFTPFLEESIPDKVLFYSKECDGHCTRLDDLADCNRECRWAPYRRFLLSLIERRREHIR